MGVVVGVVMIIVPVGRGILVGDTLIGIGTGEGKQAVSNKLVKQIVSKYFARLVCLPLCRMVRMLTR